MKHAIVVVIAALVACGSEASAPEPNAGEGVTILRLDDAFVEGTYRVGETTIRFEVEVGETFESIRFADVAGNEMLRAEIYGNVAAEAGDFTKGNMWHYGVELDARLPVEEQPEAMHWIQSQEAQLVASLWRDVSATHDTNAGPLNGLFRYGVHLEEALAFDSEGLEDRQEANCNCYGKCGPGCFSIGSNSYCRKHDCCCRTYGSAACYTWCFFNPKCPAAICR